METLNVVPGRPLKRVSLADRYELEDGRVYMTGVQALVRVLLDQHRSDSRAGLRTASLVSGYQGSPLGGFDREVAALGKLGEEHEIVLRPGLNEELAATAVWGSQIAATLPGPRFDGVIGVWYGKGPGVDRAADAIRHGNYVGADPRGGVVALCGDDPACKSSTLPSASEPILSALNVPVLVPGDLQDAVDLGRHAIACSRASGLWAALKIATNVADAAGTVEVGLDRVVPRIPTIEWEGKPYVHHPSAHLLAPDSLEMERTLFGVRLELAKRYAPLNGLNQVTLGGAGARVGIVASGPTFRDLRRALADLGLGDDAPVRLLRVGMPFPLDEEVVREFAAGLEEIVVVEEKASFLERLVKDALYGVAGVPRVFGKQDERGAPLVPSHGILDADAIARIVGPRLAAAHDLPGVGERLERLAALGERPVPDLGAVRTPFFCSGCPHNSSTVAEDDTIVGAGIGCHTLVMLAPKGHGLINGVTQMGGEGVQWVGVAPFVDVPHFTQNLGDGTFHHSGSLAIRAAVAAGLNVTYRIFFNGTVAMTGGQSVEGQMPIPDATRSLAAEGVRKIVVTTDDPGAYNGVELAPIAKIRPRSEMRSVQRDLAEVEGVTVLIHDQACATELRRARKRGLAPDPARRVVINERVCEGCGDCGEKSGCLSVEPVETEFGRKTRINQTSCNKDYSCLEGDCPSFLTVIAPEGGEASAAVKLPDAVLPEPRLTASDDVRVRFFGIGGTGVVTVSQVLGMAALLDGRDVSGLDQTGLSQKAGPVVSDVRLTGGALRDGVTVPGASADLLIGLDLLGATRANLRVAAAGRTRAVVSTTIVPTGPMVVDVDAAAPDGAAARASIDAVSTPEANVYLDAQGIAERLFGDVTPVNVLVLGAAWQTGALPVSLAAVEEAFRLNGVAVERNLAAFAWGRAAVCSPATLADELAGPQPAVASPAAREAVSAVLHGGAEPLRGIVETRFEDLLGWGGEGVAERYLDEISRVLAVEAERLPGSYAFTEAVAKGLHKLLAYKDEYEVARLHLEHLRDLAPGTRIRFHLHPPLLRAFGMRRKLELGRWFVPFFRVLRRARFLRGTPLDPFGYARVRRVERELPREYLELVSLALAALEPERLSLAVEVAELPELIRGYEQIKLAGVERFRARAAELRLRFAVVTD